MTATLKGIAEVLNTVKGMRMKVLLLAFAVFVIYLFKNEIKYLFNTKVVDEDRIVLELNSHHLIDNSLKQLMADAKADRAYIFRFHNGDEYYNGTHKNKMSCDYEVVTKGTSREAVNLQNMPVSLFSTFIKDVIELNMFYPNIDSMADVVTKAELQRQGIIGLAAVPYYRDGKLMAIIGIDYIRELHNKIAFGRGANNSSHWLTNKAIQIGDLLK